MAGSSFSVCVHILTLLTFHRSAYLSSDFIAGSININPAMVRKETRKLSKAGLVESKEGKSGGVRLSRAPVAITLADVYLAVHEEGRHLLPMYKNEPNRKCTVGANIQRVLDDLYADIDEHVLDKLSAISLENLYRQFC